MACAVSGGPDSSALLVLAAAAGLEVTAVHVDHGLREGSGAEAGLVERTAVLVGARFRAVRAHVAAGPNLEARARAARRAALPPGALTGHTADDQAETVLLNLLRGAGPHGLGAMAPATHPLLGLRRAETVGLCRTLGLQVVADPTNADPAHRRNRVRHQVLPLLAEVAGRDVVPVIARAADHQRELAALVDDLAASVDPTDAAQLASTSRPVAAAAVRRWLRDETGQPYPVDAAAFERVMSVASGRHVAAEVAGGYRVARTAGRLRVVHPGEPPLHGR